MHDSVKLRKALLQNVLEENALQKVAKRWLPFIDRHTPRSVFYAINILVGNLDSPMLRNLKKLVLMHEAKQFSRKSVLLNCLSLKMCQFNIASTENTHSVLKGKYHCMAGLLFDWLGIGRTSKSAVD